MATLSPKNLPARLPKPDSFGNYWLGAKPHGPAILHSALHNQFMASAGTPQGLLLVPTGVRYFATPEGALAALLEVLEDVPA